jgi:quercetin dioxygenase-like cupin family protein
MIVRIYTGHDGQTHFEDLPLPAEESHNVALQAGANLVFRCFPADYWSDWHTAPRRQYIFILVGQMEIGIGDGTTRRFGPGDVVLADDLTGQGHTTRSSEPGSSLIVVPGAFTDVYREQIIGLVAHHRIPSVYAYRYFTAAGGLISYGVDSADIYRRAAAYVDRILKGEKPADLPVQQPTKFELVINLKTAKALGLTVPLAMQMTADEVIE